MRTHPLLLPLLALAALLAFSASPALAQDDDFAISQLLGRPGLLSHELQLDIEQVAKFRTLSLAANNVAKPLLRTNVSLLNQIRGEFDAASPDTCKMGQLALTRHQNWLKAKAAYLTFDHSFSAILTPDQLATYEALKAGAAAIDTNGMLDDGATNGDR